MKIKRVIFVLSISVIFLAGCKLFAKAAAKHWTKQQIKEFTANCEKNAGRLVSDEKAADYCDCAVDVVAEKYTNYEDVKKTSIKEVLRVAKDCIGS